MQEIYTNMHMQMKNMQYMCTDTCVICLNMHKGKYATMSRFEYAELGNMHEICSNMQYQIYRNMHK